MLASIRQNKPDRSLAHHDVSDWFVTVVTILPPTEFIRFRFLQLSLVSAMNRRTLSPSVDVSATNVRIYLALESNTLSRYQYHDINEPRFTPLTVALTAISAIVTLSVTVTVLLVALLVLMD